MSRESDDAHHGWEGEGEEGERSESHGESDGGAHSAGEGQPSPKALAPTGPAGASLQMQFDSSKFDLSGFTMSLPEPVAALPAVPPKQPARGSGSGATAAEGSIFLPAGQDAFHVGTVLERRRISKAMRLGSKTYLLNPYVLVGKTYF